MFGLEIYLQNKETFGKRNKEIREMKKLASLMILIMISAFDVLPLNADATAKIENTTRQNNVCTVADPTGTPLNVRSEPINGRVVTKLKNGTVVRVEDFNEDSGDETANWWKISITKNGKRRTLGWVTSKFLNCN
jgi:Bacterial SH3 domain